MRSIPVVAALVLILVALTPLTAQALTVSTDKASYMPGETVVVSGTSVPGATVGIAAYNPAGTMVYFTMVTAGAGGAYSASIKIPRTLPYENWVYGTYSVEAKVGATTATTSFTISAAALLVGKVVDEVGNPVAGAEVKVKGTAVYTTTGSDGSFSLAVDVGNWVLVASKAGYVSAEKSVRAALGVNEVGTIAITSLESLVAKLQSTVASLSAEVSALSDKVKALEAQVATIAVVSQKIDNVSAKIDALSKSVSDLSKQVSDLSTRLTAIETSLRTLSTSVSALEASVKSLEASVKDSLTKVNTAVDSLKLDITGLRTDIAALSSAQKDLSSKVDAVSSKVDSVGAALSGRISGVEGSVGGLSAAVYAAVILSLLAFIMSLLVYTTVKKAIAK
ncbi:MAG: carboxypeptidase regulatory-like domain-containing protein [Sulfolobales archaeon]|nr:carboxypeptidase regulatory-like domain-containing protein [Sulfolobales archaeon]